MGPDGRLAREYEDLVLSSLRGRLESVFAGKTYRQIAEATGLHPETARRYMRDGKCSALFLVQTALCANINGDWLLTGRGYPELETPTRDLPASDLVDHLANALSRLEAQMQLIEASQRQHRNIEQPISAEAKPAQKASRLYQPRQ